MKSCLMTTCPVPVWNLMWDHCSSPLCSIFTWEIQMMLFSKGVLLKWGWAKKWFVWKTRLEADSHCWMLLLTCIYSTNPSLLQASWDQCDTTSMKQEGHALLVTNSSENRHFKWIEYRHFALDLQSCLPLYLLCTSHLSFLNYSSQSNLE